MYLSYFLKRKIAKTRPENNGWTFTREMDWTGLEYFSLFGITFDEASFTGGPADADEVTCRFDVLVPSEDGKVNLVGNLFSTGSRRFNVVETVPFVAGQVVKVKGVAFLTCEAIYFDK